MTPAFHTASQVLTVWQVFSMEANLLDEFHLHEAPPDVEGSCEYTE